MALNAKREAEFFDRLPKSAKRDLTKGALRVLLAILEFRIENDRKVYCTDEDCASILGHHHNSIRRHYPELEAKGFIRRLDVIRGVRTFEIIFNLRPSKGADEALESPPVHENQARASMSKSARSGEQKCAPRRAKARASSSLVDSGQIGTDTVPSPVPENPPASVRDEPPLTPERDGSALAGWKTKSLEERAQAHGVELLSEAELAELVEQATLHGLAGRWARVRLNTYHRELQSLESPPEPVQAPPPVAPANPPTRAAPTPPRPFQAPRTPDPKFPVKELAQILGRLHDPEDRPTAASDFAAFAAARYRDPDNETTRRHLMRAALDLHPDRLQGIIGEMEQTKRFRESPPCKLLSAKTREALDDLRKNEPPPGHPGKSPGGGRGFSRSVRTPVQEGDLHVK